MFNNNWSIVLIVILSWLCLIVHSTPIHSVSSDPIENIARLLIEIDELIENAALTGSEKEPNLYNMAPPSDKQQQPPSAVDHPLIIHDPEPFSSQNETEQQHEERFSSVLGDLKKIEDQIKDVIAKANTNRQFRLVMRLRPLLGYVGQIHRNMEMLRTRVVTIATLSNLAMTVNDVLVQFADVMTSSTVMNTGIVPKPKEPFVSNGKNQTSIMPNHLSSMNNNPVMQSIPQSQSSTEESVSSSGTTQNQPTATTLSYFEMDSENFFRKVILDHKKK